MEIVWCWRCKADVPMLDEAGQVPRRSQAQE
jgi:hypothetical protein